MYVDDILITGDDFDEMQKLKECLDKKFKMKDLGILHYFLRIEAVYHEEWFILAQKKFTLDLLKDFNCENRSPISSSLVLGLKLTPIINEPLAEPSIYRRLVGKLNYLTNTIPVLYYHGTISYIMEV